MKIADIKLGARFRKDLGDIAGLARSIEDVGLLHPVVVRPDGTLIAGLRRVAAFKKLGRAEIPATAVTNLEEAIAALRAQQDENTCRKDFAWTEVVANGAAIEALLKPKAKERQKEHGGTAPGKHSGQVATSDAGRVRHKVAAAVGKKARSYDKAKAIVASGRKNLIEDMDRTGRVDGPYKRLVVAEKAAAIAKEPPPLPGRGPYRVIVVDPPWPYELRKADPSHRATHPYPQMSIAQICAMPVASLAHADCILWLWTTNHHMREAFTVLDAWGFQHKTILTWVKNRMGTGDWLRGRTEHCLMAVRGKPIVTLTNQTTALDGPLRENSRKPDEFYAFVESLCPGSRAELFSREPRPGWEAHGDEVPKAAHG